MANIAIPWQVEGVITPEQSVVAMIDVIQSKGIQHSGTFWTWENKVRLRGTGLRHNLMLTALSRTFGDPQQAERLAYREVPHRPGFNTCGMGLRPSSSMSRVGKMLMPDVVMWKMLCSCGSHPPYRG